MSARTSWSVRADQPPRRDTDPGPSAGRHPLFADLLESRFDASGRLVRRGDARSRMAERLGRDLPDVDVEELEQAVAHLGQQIEAAQPGASPPSHASSKPRSRGGEGEPHPAEPDRHAANDRGSAEGQTGGMLDVLNRLEARLAAMSEQAGQRQANHAWQPARTATGDEGPRDRRGRDEEIEERRAEPRPGGTDAAQQALERLAGQIESLDRNDRSLARAMEAVHAELGELRASLPDRHGPASDELGLIAERLEALGERLAAAEIGPSALSAVERGYEQLMERIGRLERLSENAAPPRELVERLEKLRQNVHELPGRGTLSKLEDRLLDLAERIDAAAEQSGGGRAIERLESQLDEIAGALTDLKQAEQTRTRDIDGRLAELLRRLEAAPRGGGSVDLSAIESRIEDVLVRIDASSPPQFAEAMSAIEARLEALGQALEERPAVDLDPLTRQLKQLQGRLDQVSRSVAQGSDRAAPDIEPLNRRLEEIQRRLEEAPPPAPDGELTERLRAMEDRLASLSDAAVPDLGPIRDQLAGLAERLDGMSPADRPDAARMTVLMERLEGLLQTLGREDALAGPSGAAVPDLEPIRDQLAGLAERLDGLSPVEQPDAARLTGLMERLERLLETIGGEDRLSGIGEAVGKISDALEAMSDAPALEDIAELRTEIALLRREMKALPGGEAAASEELGPIIKDLAARIDRLPSETPLTTADLEAQIDRIVRMMEEPGAERRDLGPIEDSLRRIEEQLESGSRAQLSSALSQMDEMGESEADSFTHLVSALSSDLSALKETASSSQRNMRETLNAVHETLSGMATRIATLERQEAAGSQMAPAAPAKRQPEGASAEPQTGPAPVREIALGAAGSERATGQSRREQPAAGDSAPEPEAAAAGSQGLLGRLTSGQLLKRATGGRTESFSPAAEEPDDGPDLPLEPGTEEPMSSVLESAPSSDTALFSGGDRRKSRAQGRAGAVNRRSEDGDYVANDFLSAARRAAQAAAAEAAEAERSVDTDEQVGALKRLFGLSKARRRVLLAGALAIAVAFAAWQYLELRMASGNGGSRSAQAPVEETSGTQQAEAPSPRGAEPAETPSGEPSRPDSTLAFGEPLALPGELQRRAGSQAAADGNGAQGAGSDDPPAAERQSPPPDSIGPEALRRAAAEGDTAAQFEVAARYAEGRGVTQNLEEAAAWYRRAAEGGLAPAQYRLGSIYEKGIGVPKDPAAAMEWYRRAAEAGNAKAMHNLAVLYAEGVDGSSDLERAAQWFRRAAERGVRDSQFNIGVLHARGLGVPQDLIEAYKWFSVAAQSGDTQASERRDILAESMDEDDLAKARAAASGFRPQIVDPAANVVEQPEGGWGDPPSASVSLGSPDLVRQVQDLLNARGFDVGPADGRFGPRTRNAVAAFQEEMGLPATGEIDAGVVVALQQLAD